MELNANEKRNLRNLFSNPGWSVLKKVLEEYKSRYFYEVSAKRGTEFETMWNIAHKEGGKEHIEAFINQLDDISDDR